MPRPHRLPLPYRVLVVAMAIHLMACDDSPPDPDPPPPCPYGTRPECVELRFGWCVGIVPPMPDGRVCAGGEIAQCVPYPPVPCIAEDDCPDMSDCRWPDTGSSIGYCTSDAGVQP